MICRSRDAGAYPNCVDCDGSGMRAPSYRHAMICDKCGEGWMFVDYRGVEEAVMRANVSARCDGCRSAATINSDWAYRIVAAPKGELEDSEEDVVSTEQQRAEAS